MKKLFTTVLIGASIALGSMANAQPICFERKIMEQKLSEQKGQTKFGMGIQADGILVQLYKSKKGGFTITLSKPGQPNCIVSYGKDWIDVTMKTTGQPS